MRKLTKALALTMACSLAFQPLAYAQEADVKQPPQTERELLTAQEEEPFGEETEQPEEAEVQERENEEQKEEAAGSVEETVTEEAYAEQTRENIEPQAAEIETEEEADPEAEVEFPEYSYTIHTEGNIGDGAMSNPDGYEPVPYGDGYDLEWKTVNGRKVMLDGSGTQFGYGTCKMVVDVSSHNGNIDWQKVKNSGVDGAILRAITFKGGPMHEDETFERNLKECRRLGIPFGVYMYSYAPDTGKAANEANYVVSLLKKYQVKASELVYPVYYDLEGGEGKTVGLTVSQNLANIEAFAKIIKAAGYPVNVYSYKSYLETNLNSPAIHKYVSWVAQYGKLLTFKNTQYKGNYGWQYRSNGAIPGIAGEADVSCFSNFYGYDTQNTVNAPLGRDEKTPYLEYRAYNKGVEWLPYFQEPNTAGTTGRNLPLSQLMIRIQNAPRSAHISAKIEYAGGGSEHISIENVEEDTVIGKKDQAMRRVNVSLENVEGYRMEYRVHSSNIGWQSWVKQGTYAGNSSQDIQAVEFRLVPDKNVTVLYPQIYYRTHIANAGWLSYVPDSQISGAIDKGTPIQALQFGVDGALDYTLAGRVYVDGIGWKQFDEIDSDTVVGTVGQSKVLKAVQFEMKGQKEFQLQYSAYLSGKGWTDWAENGSQLGDEKSKGAVEAVRFRLLREAERIDAITLNQTELTLTEGDTAQLKAELTPDYTTLDRTITWSSSNSSVASVEKGKITAKNPGKAVVTATASNGKKASCTVTVQKKVPSVLYQTHIQDYGWEKEWKKDGKESGTTGAAKRLEAIHMKVTNSKYDGGIRYKTHIQDIGWEKEWKKDGDDSGTSKQSKRLEAIQIELTGELAKHYDVYYQVHAQNFGWLDWAKNGELAGTSTYAYRLESIRICLVEKGEKAPGATKTPFRQQFVKYQTHVQNIGWQSWKTDGAMSGTTKQSKRLEGIKLSLLDPRYSGGIEYMTHIQDYGWEKSWSCDGGMSGTQQKSKRLEAIRIRLTKDMAAKYDIYYRVHAQNFGWLGWAKNGASAGTEGYAYRLEGIEVKLVAKGAAAPGKTDQTFVKKAK